MLRPKSPPSSFYGNQIGTTKYYPYGSTRSGSVPTDKKFTGQRLDGTGLYFYNARYYDPTIGRFISADSIVPNPMNPQSINRYGYCLNNPLKYVDPSGLDYVVVLGSGQQIYSEADLDHWYEWVHSNFPVGENEITIFLPDIDPTGLLGTDVGPRLEQLESIMEAPLTNIKLVGYSEGAATLETCRSFVDIGTTPLGHNHSKVLEQPFNILSYI